MEASGRKRREWKRREREGNRRRTGENFSITIKIYQYDTYKGKMVDYSWVPALLGPDNLVRVPSLVQQLQKMKSKSPTFDEFVKVIRT